MGILNPGGDLIVVSECSEGIGSKEYADAQRRLVELGPDAFLQSILKKSHAAIDEWQTQMQLKPMAVGTIYLVTSGLSEEELSLTGVNIAASAEEAVRDSLNRSTDRSVAVIPEGPYLVPVCQSPDIQSAAA